MTIDLMEGTAGFLSVAELRLSGRAAAAAADRAVTAWETFDAEVETIRLRTAGGADGVTFT
jgi:hypothetical protein